MKQFYNKGASLVEILVASLVVVILIGSGVAVMTVSFKISSENQKLAIASGLISEMAEGINNICQGNWFQLYNLTKGEPNHYKIKTTNNILAIDSGEEIITKNNVNFKRYFVVENVSRSSKNDIDSTYNPSNDDPATQKVTFYVLWGGNYNKSINTVKYYTRSFNNKVWTQSDWSGGAKSEVISIGGPVNNIFATSTNINYTTPGQINLVSTGASGNLESIIYDTQLANGAIFNSLIWQGKLNNGVVKFQLACSNSKTGPWTYLGPNLTTSDYYQPTGPDTPVQITRAGTGACQNQRYLRYKVFLEPSAGNSPIVNQIAINYSF